MIGYYKPYASSHDDLDQEPDLFKEVDNVAQLLADSVQSVRNRPHRLAETTIETAVRQK